MSRGLHGCMQPMLIAWACQFRSSWPHRIVFILQLIRESLIYVIFGYKGLPMKSHEVVFMGEVHEQLGVQHLSGF